MFVQGFISKDSGSIEQWTLKEPFAFLKGSLHGEMGLQIDGKSAVHRTFLKVFYISPQMVLLLLQGWHHRVKSDIFYICCSFTVKSPGIELLLFSISNNWLKPG